MAHLDVDDTKYYKDSEGAKETEGVRKITNVISNQMNPFTCEDQELINISTGLKAISADFISRIKLSTLQQSRSQ